LRSRAIAPRSVNTFCPARAHLHQPGDDRVQQRVREKYLQVVERKGVLGVRPALRVFFRPVLRYRPDPVAPGLARHLLLPCGPSPRQDQP
jgi:hypothetical protein